MKRVAWDDMQFFLAVARSGQLSAAARKLGTSHVTVSRRIDRLEQSLRLRLFERNPRGYEMTTHGRRLVEYAERMEEEAEQMQTDLTGVGGGQRGTFRMAVPEGMGSYLSTHLLQGFAARFPNVSLELITLPQVLSLSRREVDVSITLDPIKATTFHSEKLLDYTLFLYATEDYLARHPPILHRDQLLEHDVAGYIEEMIFAPGLDYLGEVHPGIRPHFKSSSIFNQLAATRAGLAVTVLPHYIACRHAELKLVLPEVVLTRSYWLNGHRDVRQIPRERAIMDWLKQSLREHAPNFRAPAAVRP